MEISFFITLQFLFPFLFQPFYREGNKTGKFEYFYGTSKRRKLAIQIKGFKRKVVYLYRYLYDSRFFSNGEILKPAKSKKSG